MPRKQLPAKTRWSSETLFTEGQILRAAAILADGRTSHAKHLRDVADLLIWAASQVKRLE